MHTLFLKFIWRGKKPRVKYAQLASSKKRGGWGAPDIKKYYTAVILSRIPDWINNNKDKQWVKIENIRSGVDLGKNIWIPPQVRKLNTKTFDITKHVLNTWDKIHTRERWKYNSPLVPLKGTDYFPPGREDVAGRWILSEEVQLKDVTNQETLCTYQDLKVRETRPVMDSWKYRQLKHFVESLPQPIRSIEDLYPLEKALIKKSRRGGMSRIYRSLIEMGETDRPRFLGKWEEELGNKISNNEARRILSRVNGMSVNYRIAEMNYRVMARMYITPDLAHKMQDEISQFCWRGCGEVGTAAHIWWSCPEIRKFWEETTYLITNKKIPDDPWVCLHHGGNIPSKSYRKNTTPPQCGQESHP